jgi:hypothetical protein
VIGRTSVLVLAIAGAVAAQGVPDLVVDADLLGSSTRFDVDTFPDAACELAAADRCVGAPGARRLLRFSVQVENRGTADVVLGKPPGGAFVYSACHMHYHFNSFAGFVLRQRGTKIAVAPGEKRAFCVGDDVRVSGADTPRYCCDTMHCSGVQGVQVGWADLYPSALPCQWIDVTDVAAGDYDLCVDVNTAGLIAEDTSNDESCVPVTLTAVRRAPPRVRVRAPRTSAAVAVGGRLRVAWKRRVHGKLLFQDVWLSRDGGATYAALGRLRSPDRRAALRVPVTADMVGDTARVRVWVCARNPAHDRGAGALQCGSADSEIFRITQ